MSSEGPGGRPRPDGGDDTVRTRDGEDRDTVRVGSDGFDPDDAESVERDATEGVDRDRPERIDEPPAPPEEAGWRGWLLVGAVVVAFLVVPGIIYWRPPVVPFRVAFLVLPLIPAFVLGAVAVYVAVASRQDGDPPAP